MKKKQLIAQLEQDYQDLEKEYYRVSGALQRSKAPEIPTTQTLKINQQLRQWWNKYPKYSASASLDLWPIQDWFRLKYYPYSLGKAVQLNLGPIRLDFYKN